MWHASQFSHTSLVVTAPIMSAGWRGRRGRVVREARRVEKVLVGGREEGKGGGGGAVVRGRGRRGLE